MNRGRALILTLALCALAAFALPAAATARVAFYTGEGEGTYAAPIELANGTLGEIVPLGNNEVPPPDVAITPDGSTAYVTGEADELVGIDVATDTEARSVPMSGEPWAVAIAPDGKHAYTANLFEDSVSILDLATLTEVTSIPVPTGSSPDGVAVSPDGSRLYVSLQSEEKVAVIDLATNTVIDTIPVGVAPRGIAITPDGKRVVVVNRLEQSVSVIDTATDSAALPIPTGTPKGEESWVAITPDGSHAYVIGGESLEFFSGESWVTPIDLTTDNVGTPVPFGGRVGDIAILPAGNRAYMTHFEPQVAEFGTTTRACCGGVDELLPLDLGANSLETGLETYELPEALAIVPNQPPHAAIEGPTTGAAGAELSFSGTKSTDSDGSVARYDWSFGDGTSAANGGATVHHAYSQPGTYTVTLTTTDNEGCSTELVFTGQTAYCNGSSVARTTHQVVVNSASLARCPAVTGNASSFTPRIRPGHVVPGVRVRLAVGTPSRLDVKAKLLWSLPAGSGNANLHSLSVNVKHWRRIRFALPASLRDTLPLGTPVTLQLTITTSPLGGPACAGTTTHKTLHVHVVKVFPNAVQFGRVR